MYQSRQPIDVKALWAAEEAKPAEERRGGRATTKLADLEPWTIQATRLPKYKQIHSIKPLQITHAPGRVFHFKSTGGNNHYYITPNHTVEAQNDKAIAAYNKALPKEEGSVRT